MSRVVHVIVYIHVYVVHCVYMSCIHVCAIMCLVIMHDEVICFNYLTKGTLDTYKQAVTRCSSQLARIKERRDQVKKEREGGERDGDGG